MYKITEIHYRDIYGKLLWKTEMVFSRLHGVGETLVWDYQEYTVHRVAVVDNIQHVNLEPMNAAEQDAAPDAETAQVSYTLGRLVAIGRLI